MFRKSDFKAHPLVCGILQSWKEPVIKVTPSLTDAGQPVSSVSFPLESCEDRSKVQLNPDEVTMQLIVETGTVIDPSAALHVFQNTDVADLENYRDRFGLDMFDFIQKYKQNLVSK